ncbi:MAG: hypothetical protein ACLSHO_08700 [Dysosmobacter sp.]
MTGDSDRHPAAGGGQRLFRGGADGGGHPPAAGGGKCRCRDITVAARNMADYDGTIEAVFERYGIPVYLSRRSDILEKPVLSLLTGVLSLHLQRL